MSDEEKLIQQALDLTSPPPGSTLEAFQILAKAAEPIAQRIQNSMADLVAICGRIANTPEFQEWRATATAELEASRQQKARRRFKMRRQRGRKL